MNRIIIINGKPKSGKDQFVKFYKKYSNKKVNNISTVDNVKKIAKEMGWNGLKDLKSRKFLSDLKDLWIKYNDGIFKDICNFIDNENENSITFIHCREPKEIKKFKEKYKENCTTLLIERKENKNNNLIEKIKSFFKRNNFGNNSDDNVNNYNYEKIYNNIGDLKMFENNIKNIVSGKIFLKNYK